MPLSKILRNFKQQIKSSIVLYVDVYPYMISDKGEILFLLLKRRDDVLLPGDWQVICGKINEEEEIKAAFLRQIRAKTNQNPAFIYKIDFINIFYDDYYDAVLNVPCAAALLKSPDISIDSNLHTKYKWANYEEACKCLVLDNQKKCLDWINTHYEDPNLIRRNKINIEN